MKKILSIFCIIFSLCKINSQEIKSRELFLKREGANRYQIDLKNSNTQISFKVSCIFMIKGGLTNMATVIDEITYKDGSDNENAINANYQKFVKDTINTVFDRYGYANAILDIKRPINTELLAVEFPKQKIKEGDSWEGKKSATPDLVFKSINTKYKCKKISDDEITIEVDMTFEQDKNADPSFKSMKKNYKGIYTVKNDGTVKSALLDISGFSGFSNLVGILEIKEIE